MELEKNCTMVVENYDTFIIGNTPRVFFKGSFLEIGKDEGGIFIREEEEPDLTVPRENKELHDASINVLRDWKQYRKDTIKENKAKLSEMEEVKMKAEDINLINKEVENILENVVGKDKMDEIKQKADKLVKVGSVVLKEIYEEIMPMIDEYLEKEEQKV